MFHRVRNSLLSTLLLAMFAGAVAHAEESPPFVLKWGSPGSGDGQFSSPRGVAVDGSRVYVADYGNHRIQKFSASGAYLAQWFAGNAWGVAADSDGNVYVTDYTHDLVRKFTSAGGLVTQWNRGQGNLTYPSGIAVDGGGNVYVVDGHTRIQKFTRDGAFITSWGSQGYGDGQFWVASGIAIDASDNVYVADGGNYRIQKFTSGGTFLLKWGSKGAGASQFELPEDVAVDADGNVYVADTRNQRIQKFTGTGTWLATWGAAGSGDGQFGSPRGIVASAGPSVYISDYAQGRIQKFGSGPGAVDDVPAPRLGLDPPRPNPSNQPVTFRFGIPEPARVDLGIFDLSGRLIARLASGERAAGAHDVVWNLRTAGGTRVPPGIYFSRFTAGSFVAVRKLVVAD